MQDKHPLDEIKNVIRDADAVQVSTFSGRSIRSRVMHFGIDDNFNIYLASMKDDPKTVQLSSNRNVTLLFRKIAHDERDSAEVEVIGLGELVRNEGERRRGFELEAPKSSIVRHLLDTDNTRLLDCIKVRPVQVRFRVFREIVQGVAPTVYDFPQNSCVGSEWQLLRRKAKLWSIELRLPFLTGSVLPVVLGAMVAFTIDGLFDWPLFLLALMGGVLLHLGANVFNDYFDHKSRNDELNKEYVRPFSGGSRMIQLGLLSPLEVLSGAIFLSVGATAIGAYLAWVRGWPIIVFGLVGLLSGFFYTAPPLNLASRGIGELFVGLNFSVLMTLGSYYVQTGGVTWLAFISSLPLAFLIAAVLYVNEFPDYTADKAVGKRHLVVRLGREKATWGAAALFIGAYVPIVLGVLFQLMPIYALIALFAVPFVVKAMRFIVRYYSSSFDMVPANAATIMSHMFTGILLVAGFAFTKLETVGVGYVALCIAVLVGVTVFFYWSSGRKEAAMTSVKKTVA